MENNNLQNNKQAEDLDKMLAGTTEESAEYDTTQILEDSDKSAKTRNARIIAGCIIGVILLTLLSGLIGWWQASNKPQFSNAQRYESTQNLSKKKADEKNNKARELADFYRIHGNMEIQPYYFKPRNEMTADNKADALKRAKLAFDESLKDTFPSKNAYLTQDYMANTIYDDYQRLLNPVYGGWDDFYKKDALDYKDTNSIFNKSGLSEMFDKSLKRDADISEILYNFGDRVIDDAATKKDAKKFVHEGLTKYVHWDRKLPVGQVTGQIKCKYNIQNTDNDILTCKAPARSVLLAKDKKNKDCIYDYTMGLQYKVNHDQSLSKRRILIIGYAKE
ncbi:hypothetical protein GK675_01975 [Bifidobacteriaceae bacterium NR002]|nr:hypothetical protein [Bifidobacteriaceae bacterium NR002]MDZ7549667.1 hypothetical protein [Bifidobacteriaceae bacterium NR047]